MKHSLLFVPICALLCTTAVQAQAWSDNFDTYTAGAPVVGLGGWEEWGPGAGANVTSAQALSGSNSIDIVGATDLVHQYPGVTSGKWVYRTMQYIPSTTTGTTYFILLNTYNAGQAVYNWSVQVEFDAALGTVTGDFGASNNGVAPLIADAWVEIKVFIDLDNDITEFFYNGEQVGPAYSWMGGVFGAGTGVSELGAVDLYANSSTSVYYDDMELYPFEFESFGSGCTGSQGDIDFSLTLPASLNTGLFVTDIVNLPTAVAAYVLSLNKLVPPVDLSVLGMTNCWARVTPDVLLTLPTVAAGTSYTSTVAVTFPNNPLLLGLNVHMQALALDPGTNAFGFVLSDGMTFVINP
tara:strand:+ start:2030 stop:3085 length:1056 start_codon:yes stop_codon:yes gene_type:complete